MRGIWKRSLLTAAMLLLALGTFACNSAGGIRMSYYDSTRYGEGAETPDYNENLFYINDFKINIADPFVLRITDEESSEYGYYYMYGTSATTTGLETFRSKDLVNWDPVTKSGLEFGILDTLDKPLGMPGVLDESMFAGLAVLNDIWAPEVVYDDEIGKYYMFFSASPYTGEGEVSHQSGRFTFNPVMFLAESDTPYGPFSLVRCRGTEEEESLQPGATEEEKGRNNYRKFLTNHLYYDPVALETKAKEILGAGYRDNAKSFPFLTHNDPHPFIDPKTGDKYIFMNMTGYTGATQDGYATEIFAVKMKDNDWTTPDIGSLTRITELYRYEVGGEEENDIETTSTINEGSVVVYHNGKYILTLSVGSYGTAGYAVIQAVSDNVLGPYRKLTEDEGGVVLSSDYSFLDATTGTGHHSLVQVDGEYYMIYHKHFDPTVGGGNRYAAVDRVRWVDIIDKNGNPLTVMYVNGPTVSPQPKLDFVAEYKNIAGDAQISATALQPGSTTAALNDGLLSVYRYTNPVFNENYIHEMFVTGTSEITLTFKDYRAVTAIMIYNSKSMSTAFDNIARIEFDFRNGTETGVKFIEDLAFDWKLATSADGTMIRPGTASIAEFYEMEVKEIRITVKVPEDKEYIGLSEIAVLGK